MRATVKKTVVASVLAFLLVASVLAFYLVKNPIATWYHLEHLRAAESNGNLEAAQLDREALVRLGCFEHREFHLKSQTVTTNDIPVYVELVKHATFVNPNFSVMWQETNASVISVTAHRGDMATWEKLIGKFDSAIAK